MYKKCFSVVAGMLAVTALALCPATASAQRRGGGGGTAWRGGGTSWNGGGWRGDGWGGRGWDGGWNRGWGWGGWGLGVGLGWPYRGYGYGGYWPGYDYGYTDYYPYYASSDYFPNYASSGTYFDNNSYGSSMYGSQSMPYGYGSQAPDNEARVRVIVPPDAKVWFGNAQTQQTGQVRFFESPQLTPGKDYSYDVKAQWRDANGKDVTQTRQITVHANEATTVDFMRPTASTGTPAPPTPGK
jgi:uncharacterized protein (TIGR03000 family)